MKNKGIAAALAAVTLLSGCSGANDSQTVSSVVSSSGGEDTKNSSQAVSNTSAPSFMAPSFSDIEAAISAGNVSSGSHESEPVVETNSGHDDDLPLAPPSGETFKICSLSEALSRFSEIESKTPQGSPEQIVQTLLERNILCFAVVQAKCWTFDEKYYNDYYYMRGTAPIQSDYITSAKQIDDLFYGTYIASKADYLIHYAEDADAFTYDNGLWVSFSDVLKNADNSFETPTYAKVVSASNDEIVFERYYESNPVEGTSEPNNFRFTAVRSNGAWRLEYYITDAPAYEPMYTELIQTARAGNPDIEEIAASGVGNFGGEPFWSWYGYDDRMEWCGAFVSWCYNEAGMNGPFFTGVNSEGIYWFEKEDQWADADYRDIAPGDCIFFDWELDGTANHVGLVIGTDGKKVYTIEGNRSDACRAFAYDVDDPRIYGYGLMEWD